MIHRIQTIIETGTYLGNTTLAFSAMAPHIHTIENNHQFVAIARRKFKNKKNIRLHIGSSPEVLRVLLPKIRSRSLFFLDAHWYNYFPLLDELRAIAKHADITKVIVIHDFFVPKTTFGYDSYIVPSSSPMLDQIRTAVDIVIRSTIPRLFHRLPNKQRLDFAYIKDDLAKISFTYTHHYNTQAVGKKRGVIFIEF